MKGDICDSYWASTALVVFGYPFLIGCCITIFMVILVLLFGSKKNNKILLVVGMVLSTLGSFCAIFLTKRRFKNVSESCKSNYSLPKDPIIEFQ